MAVPDAGCIFVTRRRVLLKWEGHDPKLDSRVKGRLSALVGRFWSCRCNAAELAVSFSTLAWAFLFLPSQRRKPRPIRPFSSELVHRGRRDFISCLALSPLPITRQAGHF